MLASVVASSAAASAQIGTLDATVTSTGRAISQDLRTAPVRPETRPMGGEADDYLRFADAHGPRSNQVRSEGMDLPEAPPVPTAVNFAATTQNESGGFPPDNDLSVGPNDLVQTTNFVVSVFRKAGALQWRSNLNTFFGNSTSEFLFDPRTYYDPFWDRFVVIADGQAGSGATTESAFRVAISQSGDPLGSWWLYHFSIGQPQGDFLDFPDLGMDRNSMLFTVNDFTATGGFDAKILALSKERMYSGQGTSFLTFGDNACTVAPPYVLDENPQSFFLMACPNDNQVTVKAMANSSSTTPTLTTQAVIPVAAYSLPPTAPQAGVDYPLETGFNQFENRSVQYADRLWNVHTVLANTATPRWYEFSTSSNSLLASSLWFATNTSSDWRPHLTANTLGEVFSTWMSNDAPRNVQLQVRMNGGQGASGSGVGTAGTGPGTALVTSSQALTGQTFPDDRHRTGDYGAAALDPSFVSGCGDNRQAFIVGETTAAADTWGSQIAQIGFC